MVVVLSNNDYRDTVTQIIERDYFPSNEIDDSNNTTAAAGYRKSLTDFHRTTTSETTMRLHETLEGNAKTKAHQLSLIYQSSSSASRVSSTGTSEIGDREWRNALFFPIFTTDPDKDQGKTTSVLDPTYMMPPPPSRKRKRPTILLNQNSIRNDKDNCSLTTLGTVQANKTNMTSKIESGKLINSSATRFPNKSIRSQKISRRLKSYDSDQNTEHHWEGSTKSGIDNRNDDDSYITDLDATTIDSYSIRSELRKAQRTIVKSNIKHQAPLTAETTRRFPAGDDTTVSSVSSFVSNRLSYQLPLETPRDLAATFAIQVRNRQQSSSDDNRRPLSDTIQHRRSSYRSMKSLRSALRSSYRSTDEPCTTK